MSGVGMTHLKHLHFIQRSAMWTLHDLSEGKEWCVWQRCHHFGLHWHRWCAPHSVFTLALNNVPAQLRKCCLSVPSQNTCMLTLFHPPCATDVTPSNFWLFQPHQIPMKKIKFSAPQMNCSSKSVLSLEICQPAMCLWCRGWGCCPVAEPIQCIFNRWGHTPSDGVGTTGWPITLIAPVVVKPIIGESNRAVSYVLEDCMVIFLSLVDRTVEV